MTQKLPSLKIPGSNPLTVPLQNKRQPWYSASYSQNGLRTVASLPNNTKYIRHLSFSPNYWSCATPYFVNLLLNGQVSSSVLKEICYENSHNFRQQPTFNRNKMPTGTYKRDVELWEPKNHKKLQTAGRRIEQKIMKACLQQKENIEKISAEIGSKTNNGELVILKREGTMDKRKKAYLDKQDKIKEKFLTQSRIRTQHKMSQSSSAVSESPEISKLTESEFLQNSKRLSITTEN